MPSKREQRVDSRRRETREDSQQPTERSISGHGSHPVQVLQSTIGNQGVQAFHKSGQLQPTVSVSHHRDRLEREAERAAERVIGAFDERTEPSDALWGSPLYSGENSATSVPADSPVVDQPRWGDISVVPATAPGGLRVSETVERELAAASGGQPLAPGARSFFETRLGQDIGDVRIHTGRDAADLNSRLKANAFTHGRDIYFGAGRYQPGTAAGRKLLAHELTHVAQQKAMSTSGGDGTSSAGASGLVQRAPKDTLGGLSKKERKRIEVSTASGKPVLTSSDIKDIFEGSSKSTIANVSFRFAGNVSAKLRNVLEASGAELVTNRKLLRPNTTVAVEMDLTPIGKGKLVFRYTYYTEGKEAVMLIEQLGPAVSHTSKTQVQSGEKKFKTHTFTLSGFKSDSERAIVKAAVARVPDASLARIAGLTFKRQSGAMEPVILRGGKEGKKGGEYDPNTHVVKLFDSVFAGIKNPEMTRFGDPGGTFSSASIHSVVHEIGHAIDIQEFARTKRAVEKAREAVRKPTKIDILENPLEGLDGETDATSKKAKQQLTEATTKHSLAKDGSESPSFRRAVKQDGRVTEYAKESWHEAYAEAYSLFTLEPRTFEALRPRTFEYFRQLSAYFADPSAFKKTNKRLFREFERHYRT